MGSLLPPAREGGREEKGKEGEREGRREGERESMYLPGFLTRMSSLVAPLGGMCVWMRKV